MAHRRHLLIALVCFALGLLCLSGIACLPTGPSPGCKEVVTPEYQYQQMGLVNGRLVTVKVFAPKITTTVCDGAWES